MTESVTKPEAGDTHLAKSYASHPLHASDRVWPETNCYVDLWIELLHARNLDVEPLLGFGLAGDFEGDQWTFLKPRPVDLWRFYGIDVEELTLWRDLEAHLALQVGRGRVPLVEADAYYLPDTTGLDYRTSHTKTTIAVDAIDPSQETLRYFHNRGRFELEQVDYRGVLRIDPSPSESSLPPFCEIAKFDRVVRRPRAALLAEALDASRFHLERRPETNPLDRFAASVEATLQSLIDDDPEAYDAYAFASVRQCGLGFAFAQDYLVWLAEVSGETRGTRATALREAATCFGSISERASLLIMKMARAVHSGRVRDLSPIFEEMSAAWTRGMAATDRGLDA